MTPSDPQGMGIETGLVQPFSSEWCEKAIEIYNAIVVPVLADPPNYNYLTQFSVTDSEHVCQFRTEHGQVLGWEPGKKFSEEDCDFILTATGENWQKVADGKLDPVGAVAAKRIHLQKGPMPVVIKEAEAFKTMLSAFGRIPTAW
jgi:putative sterol carrier protein